MKSFIALFLGMTLFFASTVQAHAYIDPQRGIVQYWESKPQPKYVPRNNNGPVPIPRYKTPIPGMESEIHMTPDGKGGLQWYDNDSFIPKLRSIDPDGDGGFYVR